MGLRVALLTRLRGIALALLCAGVSPADEPGRSFVWAGDDAQTYRRNPDAAGVLAAASCGAWLRGETPSNAGQGGIA
jgi:hypothetical protein